MPNNFSTSGQEIIQYPLYICKVLIFVILISQSLARCNYWYNFSFHLPNSFREWTINEIIPEIYEQKRKEKTPNFFLKPQKKQSQHETARGHQLIIVKKILLSDAKNSSQPHLIMTNVFHIIPYWNIQDSVNANWELYLPVPSRQWSQPPCWC